MANNTGRRTLKKADLLKATKIPLSTFEHWTDRKLINASGEDVAGDGRGKPRQFGFRTMTKLAIAHKIALLGIPANKAVKLAEHFTDEPQRGRELGKAFATGKTILLATADGIGSIVNLDADQDLLPLIKESAIVIDIGAIIQNVNSRIISIATSNA